MAKTLRQLQGEYSQLLEEQNSNLRQQIVFLTQLKSVGDGAVYVVRQVGTNNYKIGHTTNYKQRKYQFDVRLPFEIKEVYVFKTKFYRSLEIRLHKILTPHRLNKSEFFDLTDKQADDLVDLIDSLENELIEEDKMKIANLKDDNGEKDVSSDAALLLKAKDIVLASGSASTSMLQRNLCIGYSRAARLIDALEAENFVSAPDGSKARKIIKK